MKAVRYSPRWVRTVMAGMVVLQASAAWGQGDVETLRKENERLRAALIQCQEERAKAAQQTPRSDSTIALQQELSRLRERVQRAEAEAAALRLELAILRSERGKERLEQLEEMIRDNLAPQKPERRLPAQGGLPLKPGRWVVHEVTQVKGMTDQFKHGTIVRTVSGSIYEISDFVFEFSIAVNPEVVVLTDGWSYRLLIEGLDSDLRAVAIKNAVGEGVGGRVIESRIDGVFNGFEWGTLFKLVNGDIWEQTSFKIRTRYRYSPRVLIWQDGATFKMKVEGVDEVVNVRQVR